MVYLRSRHTDYVSCRSLRPVHASWQTTEDSYGYKHVLLAALEAFAQSGAAGPELIAGMKAEAKRRVQEKTLNVILPYGVCFGDVPAFGAGGCAAEFAQRPSVGATALPPRVPSSSACEQSLASSPALPLGGGAVDLVVHSVPEPVLPCDGDCLSPAFTANLASTLPPLGPSGHLPGEAKYFQRGQMAGSVPSPKVNARVRLFLLAGMAEPALRLAEVATEAPPWLDVRLLDLPGHGARQIGQTIGGLPPCASRLDDESAASSMPPINQLEHLADTLVDEMWPLLFDASEPREPLPFGILGFSFGSCVAYHIELALQKRNGPAPILIAAIARPPPHAVFMPTATIDHLRRCDSAGILQFVSQKMGVPLGNITPQWPSFERTCALFRGGILLNATHVGTLSAAAAAGVTMLYDGGQPCYGMAPPRVRCPILAVSSFDDANAPPNFVARWSDVAPTIDTAGKSRFEHLQVRGPSHDKVKESATMRRAVYAQLAARAAELMSSRQQQAVPAEAQPGTFPRTVTVSTPDTCGASTLSSSGSPSLQRRSGKGSPSMRARALAAPYQVRTRGSSVSPATSPASSPSRIREGGFGVAHAAAGWEGSRLPVHALNRTSSLGVSAMTDRIDQVHVSGTAAPARSSALKSEVFTVRSDDHTVANPETVDQMEEQS